MESGIAPESIFLGGHQQMQQIDKLLDYVKQDGHLTIIIILEPIGHSHPVNLHKPCQIGFGS